MSETKRNEEVTICSPPSHPTTLGNVWVGTMQPTAESIAFATKSDGKANETLAKKSGNG